MRYLRLTLDAILDRIGSESLDVIEARLEEAEGHASRPVDFTAYGFTREDLSRIPSRPGIYRFLGDEKKLLYVGKSRDLRRRVSSYFRPVAPNHGRRGGLLDVIRDLEWATTPSEREALLLAPE